LTFLLYEGEWLVSLPGRFTPRERAPDTHWVLLKSPADGE